MNMASSTIFLLMSAAFFFCSSIYQVGAQNSNIAVAKFTKLNFPPNVAAVGSLTFDVSGGGPYFGTVDGRILRYIGSEITHFWRQIGYTAPRRPLSCNGATGFDGRTTTCGFTAGLSFSSGIIPKLYACDGYVGLTVLRLLGGEATTLIRNTDANPPFRYPNSVDAASDGNVYFVDTSAAYTAKESDISFQTGDSTGRLLKYDPRTRAWTTLMSGLGRAAGVASSADASFLLVSESGKNRIQKYYLRGEKPGKAEIFRTFQGGPSKIKRNHDGDFWVAHNINTQNGGLTPRAVKLSPSGQILATLDLSKEYQQRVNSVMQQGQQLFVAGINFTHIGRYDIV